jgi:ribonuclease VapC
MIIDTSALVSILDQEPEAERLAYAIATASERMLSAANLVETGIVMQVRRGDEAVRDLDLLLAKLEIEIIAVSAKQANLARKAFRRFGRGRHPARLNFGDCFAYALSKDSGASLLFKGEDFSQTDIAVAYY